MFSELQSNPTVPSLNTVFTPEVHPYAIVRRRENGTIEFGAIEIEGRTMLDIERSQDYPNVWAQTAACRMFQTRFFYEILRTESNPYETKKNFCGDLECLGYEISGFEAFDIDTEEDLQLAEALLLTRKQH
jgi:CMP-N-acetylneuraminic acid synthetase